MVINTSNQRDNIELLIKYKFSGFHCGIEIVEEHWAAILTVDVQP
jgi:hypothetical protein